MMERFVNWLFDTVHGRIVTIILLPFGFAFWALASLVVGEEFFSWWERRPIRKLEKERLSNRNL